MRKNGSMEKSEVLGQNRPTTAFSTTNSRWSGLTSTAFSALRDRQEMLALSRLKKNGRTSRAKPSHSCLFFGTSQIHISAWGLSVLTQAFVIFLSLSRQISEYYVTSRHNSSLHVSSDWLSDHSIRRWLIGPALAAALNEPQIKKPMNKKQTKGEKESAERNERREGEKRGRKRTKWKAEPN